jgi:SAM-dependent methyltransferase
MSGFSTDWLALREPADHAARDKALLAALAAHFAARDEVSFVDLGCGTGSNLRGTATAFAPHIIQNWRLVDHDPRLLEAARTTLPAWADEARADNDTLDLRKAGRAISVTFSLADLRDPAAALAERADIVTAAAFFDLVSEDWLAGFAEIAAASSAVYATLTYNGAEAWSPPHAADGPMLVAFHIHQRTDKGFGAAAGPAATEALAQHLERKAFTISTGQSPWVLGSGQQSLIEQLAIGSAGAVAELALYDEAVIAGWLKARQAAESCVIGHTDLLALR